MQLLLKSPKVSTSDIIICIILGTLFHVSELQFASEKTKQASGHGFEVAFLLPFSVVQLLNLILHSDRLSEVLSLSDQSSWIKSR